MKLLFKLFGILLVTALVTGGFLLWQQYDSFLKTPITVTPDNALFEIKPGSNIRQVSDQLQAKGIMPHGLLFFAYARLTDTANQLKAGEYQLEPGMKPDDVLRKFITGQVMQYQLGIIEGKTFKDILADVRKSPLIEQTLSAEDYQAMMPKLGAAAGMHARRLVLTRYLQFPAQNH